MKILFNPNLSNYNSKNKLQKADNSTKNNQASPIPSFQGDKMTNPLAVLGLSTLLLTTACSSKEKTDSILYKNIDNIENIDDFKAEAEPFAESLQQMQQGSKVLINELANSRDYYSSIYAKQIIYPSLSHGKDTPEVLEECATTIISSALDATSGYFNDVENPKFKNALESFHRELAGILVDGMNDLDSGVISSYSEDIDDVYASSDIIPPKKAAKICSLMEEYANDIMFPESSSNSLPDQVRDKTNERIDFAIDNFVENSGLDPDNEELKELVREMKEKKENDLEDKENIFTILYGLSVVSIFILLACSLPGQTISECPKKVFYSRNRLEDDMDME